MRILLISDTHGQLDCINTLVEKTKADLVIHAGDFGFYDDSSYHRLSTRELLLLVTHSPFWKDYRVDKKTSRDRLIDIVKERKLLGDFSDYQNNQKRFAVPVYAVYGNHEDAVVIKKFKNQNTICNLFLLDQDDIYQITKEGELVFSIFGLGGNFLVSNKLLRQPIAGNAGKVWATLHQFGVLYQKLKSKTMPSIFVSHVSPGKEPLLTRLIIHFMPNFWISGHMGAPYTCVWNQFTIRELDESIEWFNSQLSKLDNLPLEKLTPEAKLAFELIKKEINKDEFWFKKMWNINLPDVCGGYSILEYLEGRFYLETYNIF